MINAINQVADLQNRFTPLQVRELAIALRFTLKREEVSAKGERDSALKGKEAHSLRKIVPIETSYSWQRSTDLSTISRNIPQSMI